MISTGTALQYKDTSAFKTIGRILTIPDIGQGTPEKVDITTLEDKTKRYEAGIKELADTIAFEALMENENFEEVQKLSDGQIVEWKVVLPNKVSFTFSGSCTYTVLGFSVGEAIKFRIDIIPNSEITAGTEVLPVNLFEEKED